MQTAWGNMMSGAEGVALRCVAVVTDELITLAEEGTGFVERGSVGIMRGAWTCAL